MVTFRPVGVVGGGGGGGGGERSGGGVLLLLGGSGVKGRPGQEKFLAAIVGGARVDDEIWKD